MHFAFFSILDLRKAWGKAAVLLGIGCLLVGASAARAAPMPVAVSGIVTNTVGRPVAAALVIIAGGRSRFSSHSGTDGRYAIVGIPPGQYTVSISAVGYEAVSVRSFAVSAERSVVDIVLVRANTSSLATIGTVRVNGRELLPSGSAPTTEIDPQDLAGRGVEQLSDVLAQQIAVTMTRPAGGGPGLPQTASVRGPDPSETLIDIDGHQVNNSNTGDFDLELLDPSEFSNVEVVYGIGPSSLVGADTQGGAINFRTLDPTPQNHGLLRLSAGSFGTFGETLNATGTSDRLGYALSWHRYTSQGEVHDYPITIDSAGTTAVVGSAITATATLAKLRYSIASGDGFIELTYRDTAAVRDLSAPLSAPDNPTDRAPYAPFTKVNVPGAASLTNSPAYGLDLQLPVGRRGDGGIVPATIVVRHLSSLSNQMVPNISPALNPYLFNNGDAIEDDSLQYDRLLTNGDLTFSADVRAEVLTAPDALAPAPPTQSQTQRSFVGRYDWSATQRLRYTAAAYASKYDTFGTSIDPRFAAVWTPSADSVLRASVGTGFRAPLLAERVFNPSLAAERTTEYEVGFEHRFGGGKQATAATLNLYRTNLRDPIFFSVNQTTGALVFLKNLGNVIYQGAELRLDRPLAEGTRLHASYGIDIAYPRDNPFAFDPAAPNVVQNQQFQGIPPRKAQMSLDRHAPRGFNYAVTASYESAYNELNRPAYVLVDAGLGITLGHTQAWLNGKNLTNRFDDKFTLPDVGIPYPTPSGPMPTSAYALQGRSLSLTLTQRY
ncbi:MAG: TonB-dependent receptor [Candidatus Eremiobacteraeota bacterium]|nr:TonB-dependent receptor [Candidatus Eremiobacteraeota bacterium]MBC5828465.1 TonB-dependent receptor [Candidatus Eremiobacteraeota bacterium]